MSKRPQRVLFLCIGNSCRSPMAEAFARHLGNGLVEASSAGLFPASIIQPETFQVMAERGVALQSKHPLSILLVDGTGVDLLVNMSGEPAAALLRGFAGREIAWDVPDPIGRSLQLYRSVRDEIERRVIALVAELRGPQS